MANFLDHIADHLDARTRHRLGGRPPRDFASDPSRFGLYRGGLIGLIDGALFYLFLLLFVPGTADFFLLLLFLASGVLIGGFLGGLAGLVAHHQKWKYGKLKLLLFLLEAIFLLILVAAMVLRIK